MSINMHINKYFDWFDLLVKNYISRCKSNQV